MTPLDKIYPQGTRVKISNTGDGLEHTGTICGIANNYFPLMLIYIVHLDPNNPWGWNYDCATYPTACLTEI